VTPEELIEDLRHGSRDVRLSAARSLDDVSQSSEVERALIASSHDDPDPMVRKWCLHALGCKTCKPDGVCSTDVVGVFVEALQRDRSGKVRRFAAGMMMHGQLGTDERIVRAFQAVLGHPQRVVRERAEWFLSRYASGPGDDQWEALPDVPALAAPN
jgi:HEAT repeat protein